MRPHVALWKSWTKKKANDCSERTSAGEKIKNKDDNGENNQDVNPAAKRVAADKAQKPKNNKDDGDRPKHEEFSRRFAWP